MCKKKNKLNPNVEISTINPISLLFSHHVKVWKLAHSIVSESRAEYCEFSPKTVFYIQWIYPGKSTRTR